jgi:anti-sigma regulatory factor (Ser/Thr protein kinase)
VDEIELRLPSNPKLLKIVRSSVAQLGEICGFADDERNAITLAVDEAVANIIKHTYCGKNNQPIQIVFRILDDRFEVALRDFGDKLDLSKIKSRDLDDVRPGGLGVHFIKSAMDEVLYDNTLEVGNQLTLTKYLSPKKER